VDFGGLADVYVINTCSVTHLGERKSRQLIRRATRRNPEAVVVVTGCYAQTGADTVASIPGVSLVIGTQQRGQIIDLVDKVRQSNQPMYLVGDIMTAREFEDIPLYESSGRTRAVLKIQEGCENFCSYCIIPYARGPLRSRLPESVLAEARKLIKAGFQEIVLAGIHLGAYGQDLEEDISLAAIVEQVLALDGLERLRLGSVEPTEVTGELVDLMVNNSKLCRHLHIPLQGGSDEILRAMKRHYITFEYKKLIQYLKFEIPDISISTDLIVGFPGETDEQFEEAYNFVRQIDLAGMHVFPYSKRQGTPAAQMPNQVAAAIKDQRSKRMIELAAEKERNFATQYIGEAATVLFEMVNKGWAEGFTGNYIRVFVPANEAVVGKILTVRLLEVTEDGLNGEIIGA
jgi:threonylcarbamoyladenosine tRNA methylthiotransferase MtaB